jgi:PHD/YefM family antitoxin component YafN of YafNO toxin-antitoxin module
MVVMTSREFNQSVSKAKVVALSEPVLVTDRGHPQHVLLSYDSYLKLTGGEKTLLESFAALPDTSDIDVEFRRSKELPRAAVFD